MIDKSILANYPIERVGLANGGEVTSQLMSWVLSPKNLERLKNNKDLVRKLTKMKALPSSVRLYIRNLAGVTDPITEDFFSKSELKEIKRRVSVADAEGSMGEKRVSGMETWMRSDLGNKDGVIGYEMDDTFSLKNAFTNPSVNIDMTLGHANFSKDKKGNIIVKDKHDFHGGVSSGSIYESRDPLDKVAKGFEERKKTFMPDPYSAETGKGKLWGTFGERSGSYVEETDEEVKARAAKAYGEGDIETSQYARIIAGLEQSEGIPIEIDVGKITQEDKYKANPAFARYIAQDTKDSYGKEYEDVGIPTLIREQARKYLK